MERGYLCDYPKAALTFPEMWFFPIGSEVSWGGGRNHGGWSGTKFLKGKSPPAEEKTHSWAHSTDCKFTNCASWTNFHLSALAC